MTKRDFIKLPGGSLYFASRDARDELALMVVFVVMRGRVAHGVRARRRALVHVDDRVQRGVASFESGFALGRSRHDGEIIAQPRRSRRLASVAALGALRRFGEFARQRRGVEGDQVREHELAVPSVEMRAPCLEGGAHDAAIPNAAARAIAAFKLAEIARDEIRVIAVRAVEVRVTRLDDRADLHALLRRQRSRAAWYARSEELERQVFIARKDDERADKEAKAAELRAKTAKLEVVAAPHREAYADAARKFVAALADAEAHLGEMTSAFNIVVGHAQTTDGSIPVPQLPPSAAVAALDRLKRMSKSAPITTGVMPLGGEAYGQLRLDRRNIDLTAPGE